MAEASSPQAPDGPAGGGGLPEDVITQLTDARSSYPVAEGAVGGPTSWPSCGRHWSQRQRPAILVADPAGARRPRGRSRTSPSATHPRGLRLAGGGPSGSTSPVNAGETGYGRSRETIETLEHADALLVVGGTLSDIPHGTGSPCARTAAVTGSSTSTPPCASTPVP
ncbi:hypothetical protein QJS66_10230 [Kocuria rhizophila]|nr:hypothetical protein QJS66_10230 [Kocuria rhizophila]